MTKLQSLQHALLDRHLDLSEDDSPGDPQGAQCADETTPVQARRFMKIALARKEQLLERILLEQK